MTRSLRLEVSCDFLYDILGRQGVRRSQQLYMVSKAIPPFGDDLWFINLPFNRLGEFSIWVILSRFQMLLSNAMRQVAPDLLQYLQVEFLTMGKDSYNQPQFHVEYENVLSWMSLCGLHPHGRIQPVTAHKPYLPPTVDCFLPDLSLDVRLYAYFKQCDGSVSNTVRFMNDNQHNYNREEMTGKLDGEIGLATIECHLCDTVQTAYERASALADRLLNKSIESKTSYSPCAIPHENRSTLLIHGIVRGFRGFRSLRQSDPNVHLVGAHPALSRAAIRQGLALPKISEVFPRRVWSRLSNIAKDSLIDAAELVATARVAPVCPLTPTEAEMQELEQIAGLAELDLNMDSRIEENAAPLRKLGIYDVVRSRHANDEYISRLDEQKWAWDWTWAFTEVKSALYDPRVDRSIRHEAIFRLQPLHKRLLGVFEQSVITPLRAKVTSGEWEPKGGNTQQASNLWRDAFLGTIAKHPVEGWNDFRATLDIHGLWLVESQKQRTTKFLGLAQLLDRMLSEFIQANSIYDGISITLVPKNPNWQAKQLRAVTEQSERARKLTLFLGRVALEIRNFIEHGIESPDDHSLLIQNQELWHTTRAYEVTGKKGGKRKPKKIPLLEWLRRTANDNNWPCAKELPTKVPSEAAGLIMDSNSLDRCLVLISLLIAGSQAHLCLSQDRICF